MNAQLKATNEILARDESSLDYICMLVKLKGLNLINIKAKKKLIKLKKKFFKAKKKKIVKAKKKITYLKNQYLYRKLYEFSRELDEFEIIPCDQHYLIEADKNSIDEMLSQHPKEFTERKYKILIDVLNNPNEKCLLVKNIGGAICGYRHIAFKDHLNTRINYLVKLDGSSFYFFDTYVFKKYRKKGLQKFGHSKSLKMVRDMGYKKVLAIVEDTNVPSNKTVKKFDLSITKVLWYFPYTCILHFHHTSRLEV